MDRDLRRAVGACRRWRGRSTLRRAPKRVPRLFDAEGPTSAAGRALLDRMFLVSRLELASFAVIIALMVFKPGS